ncbi:MAG TPA: GNAT family N-acetyltransferase [Polyangium sp.]|nr:GNAT family N-acetyltransferase [Polyangium sp.]
MRATLQPVYDELVKSAVITHIGRDDLDQRAFVDFELASLAEHRLGDSTDPRTIDESRRAEWRARATSRDDVFPLPRKSEWYRKCFWLMDEGKRVGTIALAEPMGMSMARCSSFYLLPEFRGGGLGSKIMKRVLHTLDKHGFKLRLDTDWTWQRTIRFYRKLGFWVYHWKRQLDLIWMANWPMPRIEVGLTEAHLSVPYGDSEVTLVRAYRRGDKFELEEPEVKWMDDDKVGDAYFSAVPTLSLELAMHGWPLVRSLEQWKENYWADSGPPEALAYKITIWEAFARSKQWIVKTPRVAGLEYPTWEEFEAEWAKDDENGDEMDEVEMGRVSDG